MAVWDIDSDISARLFGVAISLNSLLDFNVNGALFDIWLCLLDRHLFLLDLAIDR